MPPMSDADAASAERERRSRRAPTPARKGVDGGELLDRLAALRERHLGDEAGFRRATIEALQATLASGRDETRETLGIDGDYRVAGGKA